MAGVAGHSQPFLDRGDVDRQGLVMPLPIRRRSLLSRATQPAPVEATNHTLDPETSTALVSLGLRHPTSLTVESHHLRGL